MSTPVVKDVALPFALLDAAEGRVVFAVSCYLYTLLGFHLHYNLSNFVFDLSLLRRPGWSRPYLLVSRTCYLVSKWTAFANIILNALFWTIEIKNCTLHIIVLVLTGSVSWVTTEVLFMVRLAPFYRAATIRGKQWWMWASTIFFLGQVSATIAYFANGAGGKHLPGTGYCGHYGHQSTLASLQVSTILAAFFHLYNFLLALWLLHSLGLYSIGRSPSKFGKLLVSQEIRTCFICCIVAIVLGVATSVDHVPQLVQRKLVVLLVLLMNCTACTFYRDVDQFLTREVAGLRSSDSDTGGSGSEHSNALSRTISFGTKSERSVIYEEQSVQRRSNYQPWGSSGIRSRNTKLEQGPSSMFHPSRAYKTSQVVQSLPPRHSSMLFRHSSSLHTHSVDLGLQARREQGMQRPQRDGENNTSPGGRGRPLIHAEDIGPEERPVVSTMPATVVSPAQPVAAMQPYWRDRLDTLELAILSNRATSSNDHVTPLSALPPSPRRWTLPEEALPNAQQQQPEPAGDAANTLKPMMERKESQRSTSRSETSTTLMSISEEAVAAEVRRTLSRSQSSDSESAQ